MHKLFEDKAYIWTPEGMVEELKPVFNIKG